jgi:hypothetical protein
LYPRTFALFILRTLLNAIICCSQLNTQGDLGRFPASGLLVIDAVGWRSMYFIVMPRVSLIVILMMYVRYLYSINCPTVICLPSMLYLSYGETPLVNCGPWSNFLYIALPFYFTRTVYFLALLLSCYHSIRSFLCLQQTDEIDNLIVSWEQSTCLCCAGFTLLLVEDTPLQVFWRHCPEYHEASKHHLLKFGFLLLVR